MLALGDSFLEALQVEYEDTMTAYIERGLFAQLGAEVQVVNTGVSGWDPNQYLMQAREELANDTYDLVVVFLYSPMTFSKIMSKPTRPGTQPKKHCACLSASEKTSSLTASSIQSTMPWKSAHNFMCSPETVQRLSWLLSSHISSHSCDDEYNAAGDI